MTNGYELYLTNKEYNTITLQVTGSLRIPCIGEEIPIHWSNEFVKKVSERYFGQEDHISKEFNNKRYVIQRVRHEPIEDLKFGTLETKMSVLAKEVKK